MEKHFVYLKDNRVVQIAVFAEQNEELADSIAREQGFDDAVWIGENPVPHMWSSYDQTTKTFTAPTAEYLYSIGVIPVEPNSTVAEVPVE
jgi:hypothetical protein